MPVVRRTTLPDGLSVWAPNALEAAVVYREIVTERSYERHGIALGAHDVVFDVGANIGLFTTHLARTAPGVEVHAFEPIPALFEALQRNLAEHAPLAVAHNVGLAARAGEAEFEFDPTMTITSTMRADVVTAAASRPATLTSWTDAALRDLEAVRPGAAVAVAALRAGLRRPALRPVVFALLAPVGAVLHVRQQLLRQRVRCRLTTLSAALADARVDRVDLVKVDVEGAEEEVLAGIADADWPRLRQFVIEVHDADGRRERLGRLLESRGYRVVHAREDWRLHELLGISTLYAMR